MLGLCHSVQESFSIPGIESQNTTLKLQGLTQLFLYSPDEMNPFWESSGNEFLKSIQYWRLLCLQSRRLPIMEQSSFSKSKQYHRAFELVEAEDLSLNVTAKRL